MVPGNPNNNHPTATVDTSTPSRDRARGQRRPLRWLPPLVFDEPLESQYRQWHATHSRERVKYTMAPAMALLFILALAGGPVAELRATLFSPQQMPIVDALRYGVLAPTCILMLLVTYSPLHQRWMRVAAPIVVVLQGLCMVWFDLMMDQQGYSLRAVMPMMVLSAFMLFGMLQKPAAITAATLVLAYAAVGLLDGAAQGQRLFDVAVSAFALLLGYFFHYSFASTQRRNWRQHRQLNEYAMRDALTKIGNRRLFDQEFDKLWHQAMRVRAPLALLLVDLDHFKAFNDHTGHQAGDACLVQVAATLAQCARRPLDVATRYGGEEFAVLLFDADREHVENVCRELHAAVAALAIEHPASSVSPHVSVSIGAACVQPRAGRRADGLVQLADEALYSAKERGRNCTVIMDREYEQLHTGSFRAGVPQHTDLV